MVTRLKDKAKEVIEAITAPTAPETVAAELQIIASNADCLAAAAKMFDGTFDAPKPYHQLSDGAVIGVTVAGAIRVPAIKPNGNLLAVSGTARSFANLAANEAGLVVKVERAALNSVVAALQKLGAGLFYLDAAGRDDNNIFYELYATMRVPGVSFPESGV